MVNEVKFEAHHFPVVNVAGGFIFSDEVQIHQGPGGSDEVPTLDSDMKRDVISMSREQALAVAKHIIATYS